MEVSDEVADGDYDIMMLGLHWMMMGRGHHVTQHIPQKHFSSSNDSDHIIH